VLRSLCKSLLCVALAASPVLIARAADPAPAGANQSEQTFTDDSLGELLTKLGYKPTEKRYSDGVKYYTFKVTRAGMDWPLTVELTPDKRMVGFGVCLNAAADKMDRDRLFLLLQENDKLKSRFLIDKGGKNLYMTGYFDNRSVSSELFQKELDLFLAEAKKTESLWKAPTTASGTGDGR
jgi:hypothetical protein